MARESSQIECPHCRAKLDVSRDAENPFFQCARCGHFLELASKEKPLAMREPVVMPTPPPVAVDPVELPAPPRRRRSSAARVGCGCLLVSLALVWAGAFVTQQIENYSHQRENQHAIARMWRDVDVDVEFDSRGNPVKLVFGSRTDLAAAFAMLWSNTAVRSLDFSDTMLTDYDLRQLGSCGWIEHLDLQNTRISDDGVRSICRSLPNLKRLELRRTDISDTGLQHIRSLHWLEELGLSETAITDNGLSNLSRLRQLRTLYLGGTATTGGGLIHLRNLRNLETINLRDTLVSDAGLPNLRNLKKLRYLYLGGTDVSDKGLFHLASLEHLVGVNVFETRVTPAGAAHLQRKLVNGIVVINEP